MKEVIYNGILLDDESELSLKEICSASSSSAEWIIELVEEGALEPVESKRYHLQQTEWKFSISNLQKARTARRLQHDLGINTAGVALALDLLDEIEKLESRLAQFEISEES